MGDRRGPLPDSAFSLYSLLLRYGNGSGSRPGKPWPGAFAARSTPSTGRCTSSQAGIVRVGHRRNGEQFLPTGTTCAPPRRPGWRPPMGVATADGGGSTSAATPEPPRTGSRRSAATPGRTFAARVAEAGPWWDTQTPGADQAIDAHELAEMEARLAETDGLRPALQAQLTAEGMPVIRSTVARRACAILDLHQPQ